MSPTKKMKSVKKAKSSNPPKLNSRLPKKSSQPKKRNAQEPKLSVHFAGKKHRLSVERAFSLAHQLVCRGHLDTAASVLEWLEQALPNDRRVKVLHARCEARQGNYADCSHLLNEVFLKDGQLEDVPGPLHTTIVYRASNLLGDARNELKVLCSKHPELPSLRLLAGDLWLAVGRPDRAVLGWQAAMKHDTQKPKVIAAAAKNRIEELAASQRKKQKSRKKRLV
jgi:predicted Zn-dependent protease